jgi:hypothetical protein
MTSARAAAAALGLVLVVAGCTANQTPPSAARTPDGATPSASPPAADAAQFQSFAGLTLPSGVSGLKVTSGRTPQGEPQYRATFTLPSDQAAGFCGSGGLGGGLNATSLPDSTREEFGFTGTTGAFMVCAASLPSNLRIQRSVLIAGTDQPDAAVDVIAYRMPVR